MNGARKYFDIYKKKRNGRKAATTTKIKWKEEKKSWKRAGEQDGNCANGISK